MPYLIHNERKIYFEVRGEGKPLLMIAGLASDSQSWLPVIIPLSKKYQLITFDNRGVGRSDLDNSNLTIEALADDALALINHLKLDKVNVLGHSMGGMIAMELAKNYSERIESLILASTSVKVGNRNKFLFDSWLNMIDLGMDKHTWFRNVYYWLFDASFFDDAKFVDQIIKMAANYRFLQSDKSFKNQINTINNFDFTDCISEITARTLVMYGENDILFSSDCALKLLEIADSNVVTIENAAHSIPVDNPESFVINVANFIDFEAL